jgi:hypothetical protein
VRGTRICPRLEPRATIPALKLFDINILPASDCAPRFYSAFSANSMMAKIQGEGYPPDSHASPILGSRSRIVFEINRLRAGTRSHRNFDAATHRLQRTLQILNQIIHILNAHRQPNHLLRYAHLRPLLG